MVAVSNHLRADGGHRWFITILSVKKKTVYVELAYIVHFTMYEKPHEQKWRAAHASFYLWVENISRGG
jgi:hypothetical protein